MNTEKMMRVVAVVVVFAACASVFFGAPILNLFQNPADDPTPSEEPQAVVPHEKGSGDINGDGFVTSSDARTVLFSALGLTDASAEMVGAGDVDADGMLTEHDAALLWRRTGTVGEDDTKVRGLWVTTMGGDFPSRTGLGADELKEEIYTLVQSAYAAGFNTLYVQVRGHSDALYESDLFPTSRYLSGKEGEPMPLDVLETFCDAGHALGLRVHAWVNPYRITDTSHDLSRLCETNPAVLHPEWTVKHFDKDGSPAGVWYDPGLPEVRALVCAGVTEIVTRYDVDGIHIDDYFYPYENAPGFEDDESFARYGTEMDKGDWRRENVNTLVRDLCIAVKGFRPRLQFGVSPFGIWAKQSVTCPDGTAGLGSVLESYKDIYTDSVAWVRGGYVDYICPQLYWSNENKAAPFETLLAWWQNVCRGTDCRLYVGVGAYRADTYKEGEIARQLTQGDKGASGVVLFSASSALRVLDEVQDVWASVPAFAYGGTRERLEGDVYTVHSWRCDVLEQPYKSGKYGPTRYYLGVEGMRVVAPTLLTHEQAMPQDDTLFYYRTQSGLYLHNKDLVAEPDAVAYEAGMGDGSWFETVHYTYLYLPCTEPVFCALRMEENEVIVFLDHVANVPSVTVGKDNALFDGVTVERTGSLLTLRLHLKETDHIFGYGASFVGDRLVVRFKNPLSLQPGTRPLEGITVSVDPGHSNRIGSSEPYNGVTVKECDLNYELSCAVREKLLALGARVEMTHENERQKSLDELIVEMRARLPDLNVSVHFNDVSNNTSRGTAAWYCYRNSYLLADILSAKVAETTGLNHLGCKRDYYKVSRLCEFPSVLYEVLYLSTPEELAWYMESAENRERVAQGLVNGILAFYEAQMR